MMSESRSCMFLLSSAIAGLLLVAGTEITVKYVCRGDTVQAFQNIEFNHCNANVHLVKNDDRNAEIAEWSIQNCIRNESLLPEYQGRLIFDLNGTITIKNFDYFDQANYVVISKTDILPKIYEVQLSLMVAPSKDCKPRIRFENTLLIASLRYDACGSPPASPYWLGYSNLTAIEMQPGKEAYHACIHGPSLRCARGFKATDYCSTFRRDTVNEELLPKISLVAHNIPDRSIMLLCQLNDISAWNVRWRRNGIIINNNAKSSQSNQYLTIRHLSNDDKYDIYTCLESGGRFESHPYSIQVDGPSFVKLTSSNMIVKEKDRVDVLCLTDCYPLCSVEWSKLELSSGHKNVLFKNYTLTITNVTRQMSGNYSCKVQNLVTGTAIETFVLLSVYYGPDTSLLNTSNSIIEVDEFDSITIICTAECFPPCLINWTETYANSIIGDSALKLVNVSANASYRCIARNTVIDTITVSQTINIYVKLEDSRQKELSVDKDREPTIIDKSYLVYAVLTIGGIGVIVSVVCCLRKKYKHCSHVARVSNNAIIAHSSIDESHQEETLSEHYWTIVTNKRGNLFTAIERDMNVEPREFVDPAQSVRMEFDLNTIPRHHHSEELEIYTHSIHSDSIDLETSFSDSAQREGYINPIPSDPANCSEYIEPRRSNSVEFNKYIDPNPSDPCAIDIYSDPSSSDSYKDNKSTDGSIPSYPGERDQNTDPFLSDAVKRDTNTDNGNAINVQSARHPDHNLLDAAEIGSFIVASKPDII